MSALNEYEELVCRGERWLDTATPAELWDVMHHGGLDARVGMPGVESTLGIVEGRCRHGESLATRDWAADATGDFEEWFLGNRGAQLAAVHELRWELNELALDLGSGEFVDIAFGDTLDSSSQASVRETGNGPRWPCIDSHPRGC
ncbi:MAG: hypothetical protein JWQ73_2622 [Variovorax sp.]|jgi:hypothetical protein|nr:hypothetical protein [Variovorax sp.]